VEKSTYHPFRSVQAREEYQASYDRRAATWPVPCETGMVDTFLGQTFVRISGPKDAPPLVLLPGSVFNSLMWMPNITALSREFRTYAVDNIYDSGRSIYTREPGTPEDFVLWLDELLTSLGLGDRIHMVGLSYGSWLTHQYALRFPGRLAKIVLLSHPAIVSVNPGFVFRLLFCLLSPGYLTNFAHWLLESTAQQQDEHSRRLLNDSVEEMRLAGRCFQPKRTVVPRRMKDTELVDLQVPALFLIGENEKTFSPRKAVERLRRVAPHIETEMVSGAGHDLNFARPELINTKVIEFLKRP
jgi:pimeloyl-ACP methyl ester carboxylesterase